MREVAVIIKLLVVTFFEAELLEELLRGGSEGVLLEVEGCFRSSGSRSVCMTWSIELSGRISVGVVCCGCEVVCCGCEVVCCASMERVHVQVNGSVQLQIPINILNLNPPFPTPPPPKPFTPTFPRTPFQNKPPPPPPVGSEWVKSWRSCCLAYWVISGGMEQQLVKFTW